MGRFKSDGHARDVPLGEEIQRRHIEVGRVESDKDELHVLASDIVQTATLPSHLGKLEGQQNSNVHRFGYNGKDSVHGHVRV